jgi:dTDP-4-dehydrorhamnose reductase
MRRRLFVIGASGFVGGALARAAERDYDVIRGNRRSDDVEVDITRASSVERALDRARPDVVALLAAMADIDRCEREPELAAEVNIRGAENVARAAARRGARLLFTSSGAVFDGRREAYTEDDPVSPTSVYGRTKARAEERVRALAPGAVVLRLSLVLGFASSGETNSLVNRIAESLRSGAPVAAPSDEYRNPIDAGTLSELVLEVATNAGVAGILHVGATDVLSRYEIVRRLAEALGGPADLVRKGNGAIPGRAPRGRMHFLRPDRIAALCRTTLPSCAAVIERSARAAP